MRRAEQALPLRHAIALGFLQGPVELLPISSSGHLALVPWLAGWPYGELDGERRKAFEVALHAGAGIALAVTMREELLEGLNRDSAVLIALSSAPPAIIGYVLGGKIERRLGGPRSIAMGLIAGAVAMALADARAAAGERRYADARPGDGVTLGLAQAIALIPGVSRNGATLTAARARGFGRLDAARLSWQAALPVILGASVLKASRLASASAARKPQPTIVAGGGVAFLSTLISVKLLRRGRWNQQPLLPYALYRCLLGALVIVRLRRQPHAGGG